MKQPQRLASLQARLLTLLLLLVCGVWGAAAVMTWVDTRHELDELLDAHLAQSAALLIAQQTDADHLERHSKTHHKRTYEDEDAEQTRQLHKYASRVAFQVFHEGELTLHSSNALDTPMSPTLLGFTTVTWPDGRAWRVFGAEGNDGDVQVFVGEQIKSRESILWAVLQGVLMPLLYALPLLAVLGWLAVRQGLKPLRNLSQALMQRRPQAVEPLVIADTPSEIAPVVQALNALFDRIGHVLETERRFTADAAHELRTPIAAIRAQAQVALGAGDNRAELDQALRHTLEGCDRATRLVTQLLTLSRLEADGNAATQAVDVSAIAQRIAADLAPLALARHQTLALEAPEPCPIAADDALTGVLIRNLLDNALRYSPDGAEVAVQVTRASHGVTLCVQDSGPGLSAADQLRLGERFYRGLGTAQSGSGLGWSIVRRIAEVYQAQIQLSTSALGGLCVQVTWPVEPDQRSTPI